MTNDVFYPYGQSGSTQSTAGASSKATMSIFFAPAGLQGQATATADNIQTHAPAFDNVSSSAYFAGGMQLNFMVVGPALPFPWETVPIDIQGAESVQTSKKTGTGTEASASINLGGSTFTVSSSQGSTKNSSLSFNDLTQVFPNNQYFISMSMYGLASSQAGSGKAGGTVSASAVIDPYIYIDPSFADLYPGMDPTQYSIVVNSEFLNIPPPTTEVPVPATLPLFATGLGALGLLRWRTKRKVAPARSLDVLIRAERLLALR